MVGTKGHKVIENIPPRPVVDRIKGSAKTLEDRMLIYGLLYTGMRIGELLHMTRNWVRWDLNKIFVPFERPCSCRNCRKARYRTDKKTGERKLVKPANTWRAKTESAVRAIPIAPELQPVLSVFFRKYESLLDVFQYRELAWYRLKQLTKRAGVNWRIFPHLLRGCVASKLAGQDVSVYRLKELMGWKKIDMAAEYVKLFRPPSKDEVVKW